MTTSILPIKARVAKLEDQRERLLKLAPEYQNFHCSVVLAISKDDRSFNTIAREVGLSWGSLKNFQTMSQAVTCADRIIGLASYANFENYQFLIENLDSIPSRIQPLLFHTSDHINLVVRLHIEFIKTNTNKEVFGSVFGDYSEYVIGILNYSQSAISTATDFTKEISDALDNNFETRLNDASNRYIEQYNSSVSSINVLYNSLRESGLPKTQICKRITISSRELNRVRAFHSAKGNVSSKQQLNIIDLLQKMLDEQSAQPATESIVAPEMSSIDNQTLPAIQLAGKTVDNVNFVLNAEDFVGIETTALTELRDTIKRQLELSRALLNLASQLKSPQAREVMASELGPQMIKLEQAMRVFTNSHPNEMAGYYSPATKPPAKSQQRKDLS